MPGTVVASEKLNHAIAVMKHPSFRNKDPIMECENEMSSAA